MVRQMLMLQFRADASTLQIQQALGEFSALARLIDGIRSIGLGTNMNPDNLAKYLSHGVLVSFGLYRLKITT